MRRADAATAMGGPGGHALTAGPLTIDPGRVEARVGDELLGLTPTEYRLLEALVRAGGDVVPHHRLARAGWPTEADPDLLWLKPHLTRLRTKLVAAGGPTIVAVRGAGYRIEADAPSPS
jgi:two-component system response regulator BasR